MSTARFPAIVDSALRTAGWHPGRWDMHRAEAWADQLRAHLSPGGHRHSLSPAAIEAWAEFGGLTVEVHGAGRHLARTPFTLDPLRGLHLARTFDDLGLALGTDVSPLGEEAGGQALLAIDAQGRVYSLDHTGDWFLGADLDAALATLIAGLEPQRLAPAQPPEGVPGPA
jgi:SUKH-3 immunity protein